MCQSAFCPTKAGEAADMPGEPDGSPVENVERTPGSPHAGLMPEARRFQHPLGPLLSMRIMRRPLVGRVYAMGIAAGVAAVLITAGRLSPGNRHMGVHQQLGLLPCGFVTMTGLPCPTCGMTTAFAHAAHGHPIEAIRSQLAGFVLAIATLLLGLTAATATVTGRYPAVNWYRVNPTRFVWWVIGLLVVSWALKIVTGLLDGSLPVR
jgi:hypothetical protein